MKRLKKRIPETGARIAYSGFAQEKRWRSIVVLIFVCVLAAGVATRYANRAGLGVDSVRCAAQHDLQGKRQHLDRDASKWIAPDVGAIILEAPSHYPRIAPAGPPIPKQFFEDDLYNRPPPAKRLS